MWFMARFYNAHEAEKMGLVNTVVPVRFSLLLLLCILFIFQSISVDHVRVLSELFIALVLLLLCNVWHHHHILTPK